MATFSVLVVDDEAGIRSGTRRILQHFRVDYPFMDEQVEFEVLEAASGEEALDLICQQPPDIILLDNKLPGIQGVEVLEFIKQKNIDSLVVMITSYASLEIAVKATRDGAFDFIPKPFTPQELRSSMENIAKQLFLRRMTRKMNKEGKQIRFQFLSVLSHELKAPLNAVEGYLRMMQERQAGNRLEDYQDMILRSLERIKGMRTLILDLLDLTRIESGSGKAEYTKVCINELAQTAIDTMRPYAIQRDVNVYLNASDRICLAGDANEMQIILNNLISNAVKYNREGGRVDCTLKGDKENIHIIVSDTGIGIASEDQENLFRDFVRIRTPETRNIAGSGLGLSIVKKLVDIYGGIIEVKSKTGEGSIFTVTLPRNREN
ncbi:MAG TPA: hybrid sensor histidine kinase/response regulator [Bacteroidales bacterium]|nr:hybrid sensor histidine kinase/response regulator [Bacteroidales bacterium]HSA42498.1 hybrid sensor histidine kinase/response regulator [Bacteroidales bacterium]